MDTKTKQISELLEALNSKFSGNLNDGKTYHYLAEKHEIRARVIQQIGVFLGKNYATHEHQKLLSLYFDEIFGDMVCSIYFSFIGLDNPARIILRRSLELGLVAISYWDDPAAFWGWKEHNEDISFTALEAAISYKGYIKFLGAEGCTEIEAVIDSIKILRQQYSILSNVVHPKPYNFETEHNTKFSFVLADLNTSLSLLQIVQVALIKILFCRFSTISKELIKLFPKLDELIV